MTIKPPLSGQQQRMLGVATDLIGTEGKARYCLNLWLSKNLPEVVIMNALDYVKQQQLAGKPISSPEGFINKAIELRLKPKAMGERKPATRRSVEEAKQAERRVLLQKRRSEVFTSVAWSPEQIQVNEQGLAQVKQRLGLEG